MKKILILLFAFLLTVSLQAQSSSDTPYMTKSLSADNVREVFARTSGGGISVTGVSASEARIEVYVKSPNNKNSLSKEEIKERLDELYRLDVSVSTNKLTATAEAKKSNMNWDRGLSISFKIYVPESVSTDLSTSGGSIDLTNLSGTQNFSTSGGGLDLTKLSGKVRGRTSGGSINVSESKDDINLATSGGGIDAENCSGNIRLNTSGGSINLKGLNGNIEAETSGGTVRGQRIKGELFARTSGGRIALTEIACSLDASTSGGGVDIEISEVGKFITVSNSGGNVMVKMPGNKGLNLKLRGDKIKTASLNNFSGEQDENSITGKINGGGVPVSISTSGNLTFTLN